MRIGVGFDDTICRTTEIVHDRVEKYALAERLNALDIMNDEFLKEGFFSIYLEDIYTNAEIKREVKGVLKRLRSRGNEIYIITSRNNDFVSTVKNVEELTANWLNEHGIEVDKIITAAGGETSADICKKYDIDLMIDDDPYNYQKITQAGRKCLLFDDREKFIQKDDYVTNWLDIEKYIERNR